VEVRKTKKIFALGFLLFIGGYLAFALVAETAETDSSNSSILIQTLPGIEFVEVNTPSSSGRAKQLILFVHGTPGSFTAFLPYVNDPVLQEKYHMISVTRLGWVNDDDDKVPSLEQQAKALEPLLRKDQSGLGVILMGHSFGGPVIAKTAMQYRDLVAGLAFVASTGDPELSGPRWYNRFAVIIPKLILGSGLKGANAEILPLRPQLEEMLPLWETLDMPVLIVQGDKDRLVSPGNADFLVRSLVNADVTYLERQDMGHFVLWEERDLIRQNMLEIFDQQSTDLVCEDSARQPVVGGLC